MRRSFDTVFMDSWNSDQSQTVCPCDVTFFVPVSSKYRQSTVETASLDLCFYVDRR